MPKHIITKLTEEQEALLPIYRNKWRSIAMQTEPIDREKITEVIKATYAISNYPEPEILFYSNPLTALEQIVAMQDFEGYLGQDISFKFRKRVIEHLQHIIERQLDKTLLIKLRNQIEYPEYPHYPTKDNPQASFFPRDITLCTETQILAELAKTELEFANIHYFSYKLENPVNWSIWGCMFDFCISVLKFQHDKQKWSLFQNLIQQCSFIFLFEKVCIVSDRPNKLLFDHNNYLHAEGESALQFADGYGVHAYHGGARPEGRPCQDGEYIKPGTKVKLTFTGEYGIVVHCWDNDGFFDCFIAFFGDSFPDKETECRPYILRYAAVSLEILE